MRITHFTIVGNLAHQGKPKKQIDWRRSFHGENIVDVWCSDYRRIKGLKHTGLQEVRRYRNGTDNR